MTVKLANMYATFSDAAIDYDAIGMNVTFTAAGSNSTLLNLKVNGNSVFSIGVNGSISTNTVVVSAPAGYANNLLDLRVGGNSVFIVTATGAITTSNVTTAGSNTGTTAGGVQTIGSLTVSGITGVTYTIPANMLGSVVKATTGPSAGIGNRIRINVAYSNGSQADVAYSVNVAPTSPAVPVTFDFTGQTAFTVSSGDVIRIRTDSLGGIATGMANVSWSIFAVPVPLKLFGGIV